MLWALGLQSGPPCTSSSTVRCQVKTVTSSFPTTSLLDPFPVFTSWQRTWCGTRRLPLDLRLRSQAEYHHKADRQGSLTTLTNLRIIWLPRQYPESASATNESQTAGDGRTGFTGALPAYLIASAEREAPPSHSWTRLWQPFSSGRHTRMHFIITNWVLPSLSGSLRHLKSKDNLDCTNLLSTYVNSPPWAYSPHRTHFIWVLHFYAHFCVVPFSAPLHARCPLTGANAGAISWLPCHPDRT